MRFFKSYEVSLFILLFTQITSRDPFKFNYESPQPKVELCENTVKPPVSSKWTIKEQENQQVMLLENCEDGQLRAIEIPQFSQ